MTGRLEAQPRTWAERRLPSAAVTISAYTMNRWPDLARGLQALDGQTYRPDEVIVVVDTNQELAAAARELAAVLSTTVKVIEFEGGLSAARNVGVEQSTAEIVAFLDDDATPEPRWLEGLLEPFLDADVALVGGHIEPAWPVDSAPTWFPDEFLWVVGATYKGMAANSADRPRNPLGASMAIRRTAWVAVGGFATSVGLGQDAIAGCEETDLCLRLKDALPRARVEFSTKSVVRHRVTPERATFAYFRHRCAVEGRSKAVIRSRNGGEALGPEKYHAAVTIPKAVISAVGRGFRGEVAQFSVAGALVVGVATTAGAYGGQVFRLRAGSRADDRIGSGSGCEPPLQLLDP